MGGALKGGVCLFRCRFQISSVLQKLLAVPLINDKSFHFFGQRFLLMVQYLTIKLYNVDFCVVLLYETQIISLH